MKEYIFTVMKIMYNVLHLQVINSIIMFDLLHGVSNNMGCLFRHVYLQTIFPKVDEETAVEVSSLIVSDLVCGGTPETRDHTNNNKVSRKFTVMRWGCNNPVVKQCNWNVDFSIIYAHSQNKKNARHIVVSEKFWESTNINGAIKDT